MEDTDYEALSTGLKRGSWIYSRMGASAKGGVASQTVPETLWRGPEREAKGIAVHREAYYTVISKVPGEVETIISHCRYSLKMQTVIK